MDIARDGRALFSVNSSRREIVGFAAGEKAERNLTWLNWSFPKDISSDGKTVLFDEQNLQPIGIYLRKLDGSPAVRIGEGGSLRFLAGRTVGARRCRTIESGQFTLLPTGAGEPKQLPQERTSTARAATWFPDGRRILISGNEPGHGSRLFVQDIPDGKPRAITPEGVSFLFHPVSLRTGSRSRRRGTDRRIAIYPIEPGEPRAVPGPGARGRPDRDGRPTAARSSSTARPRRPCRVDIVDVKTGRRTLWKELRPPDPVRRRAGRPDADRAGRECPTCTPTGARSTSSTWRRACAETPAARRGIDFWHSNGSEPWHPSRPLRSAFANATADLGSSLAMTLTAGSRLGPYEILSPLGAGGMGEVYRAKDPRLERDVAIKVLALDLLPGHRPSPSIRTGGRGRGRS